MEGIHQRFVVDPSSCTGLKWKISPSTCVKIGDKAGTLTPQGYYQVRFGGQGFKNHRIIWALSKGFDPDQFEIDHINGDRGDNRIENLNLVSRRQNFHNKINQSIFGVGVCKIDYGFTASIGIDGARKYLGFFLTAREAGQAYQKACEELTILESPVDWNS